jgi:replicative DNA helicase
LIVIDYLQLIKDDNVYQNRVEELSSLKMLAKELNVPIIVTSQLNRNLEQRSDRIPWLTDLKDCGSIEDDADLIAFIYRDEIYNKYSNDKGTAEIIIAKQRNGPIGTIRLTFLGQYSRFENYFHQAQIIEAKSNLDESMIV